MSSVVLITGVSRYPGSRLAAQLSADSAVDRVIGVDSVPPVEPAALGRTEFVRADIRNPLIAKVISRAGVDTVVHAAVTATPRGAGGRASMKELNVIGTMQLLAACQKSESVRRVVVKSTTAVYGSSPRDPALFTEPMQALALPRSGYGKDAVEVEGYVRGFSRRRPDITVSVLRFANFIGPTVDTALTRYLSLPVVPVGLGFDPRIQLVHEDDAVEVLRLAARSDRPGIVNVAGSGALLRSQVLRRLGRIALPVPSPAVDLVGRLVRGSGIVDFSPEQLQLLTFGRVVDTTRLHDEFGYRPRYSTASALADFGRVHADHTALVPALLDRAEGALAAALRLSRAGAGVLTRG
jgi:UDP-glucose 4-epimerase